MSTQLVLNPTVVEQVNPLNASPLWVNPSQAIGDNNNYAICYNTGNNVTPALLFKEFNTDDLPDLKPHNMVSVVVTIKRRASAANTVRDDLVLWESYYLPGSPYYNGFFLATSGNWSSTEEYKEFPLVVDWSHPNTIPPDLFLTNIVVTLRARGPTNPTTNWSAAVDNVFITVTYDKEFTIPVTGAGTRCSGSATVTSRYISNQTSGGSISAGTSPTSVRIVDINATGSMSGVALNGDVVEEFGIYQSTSGGIEISGDVEPQLIYEHETLSATITGVSLAGSLELFSSFNLDGSEGVSITGAAAVGIHVIPTGGSAGAGTAIDLAIFNPDVTGAIQSGGNHVQQMTYAAQPVYGVAFLGGSARKMKDKYLVFYHESMVLKMKSPNPYNQPKPRTDIIRGNNPSIDKPRENPFADKTESKWVLAGNEDRTCWVPTITSKIQGQYMPTKKA